MHTQSLPASDTVAFVLLLQSEPLTEVKQNCSNRSLVLRTMERTLGTRRTLCQDWDEYFMAQAVLAARLSRNPYSQVGACIVNNIMKIVGIGYNGMPRERDDYKFYWHIPRGTSSAQPLYVPHAEINALRSRNSTDVADCTIYVTLFPCDNCAKEIIEFGIKTVVYLSNKNVCNYKTMNAESLFDSNSVAHRLMNKKIEINFIDINCNRTNQTPQTPMNGEGQRREVEVGNIIQHYYHYWRTQL
ncbi:deoxycytidylate deaminase-like isoform X1 [Ooceraea biroi]|uniref:deoxycytidylate deaminase-like isoform X1 n=1 Tax=Ooceraea biroi TaxID=2015173 RepID=UPI000F0809DA|nr:deoxycytidylate deaminase-like isoform X1 [Ooceraea biroi]